MARPQIHDETLKQRLLQVASTRLADSGAASLSLRSLARDAGTTTAAVYTLFGGKPELIAAVIDEGFKRFGLALNAVEHSDDPRADLLALGIAYRDYALAYPNFYRIMFDRVHTPDSAAPEEDRHVERQGVRDDLVGAPTFQVLKDAAARVTGGDETSATSAATYLWALAHGMVSLELNGMIVGSSQQRRQTYIDTLQSAVV